jgi:hypothetical protein
MVADRDRVGGGAKALNAVFNSSGWAAAANPNGQMGAPGDASNLPPPLLTQGASAPEAQNATGATLLVMNMIKAMPDNARTLNGLPSNATRSFTGVVANTNPLVAITAPFMLDGWGHPILYVPPGGLIGVYVLGNDGRPEARLKSAPDGRGFWVSAGPDGYFGILPGPNGQVGNPAPDADDIAGGDDNVYSFEN